MGSDFDIVYPPKGRIKTAGGLNDKYDKQFIADNESPSLFNVVLGSDSCETRGGSTQATSGSVGSFVGDGLYTRHDNDNSQTMCAWWNGSLYTLGASTFSTVPSAQSVFTAGVRVCAAEYENNIFFCNGGTIPYRYDGANFVRHGIYEPASSPSVDSCASDPSGVLSGTYKWKVTYVNSALVESDVSSNSTAFTTSGLQKCDITIPTAPASWGVGYRNIYRTSGTGATFNRVATVSDNATTVYTDNIADGSLGVAAPTDNGVPPKYGAIVYHKDRLFMTDPTERNLVWYSELTNPYVVKATNFINAGDNTGDTIEGLGVQNDSLVIQCSNSSWINFMPSTDPTDWVVMKTNSPFGSKSPYGSFYYKNKLMFPAVQNNKMIGFAALSGNGTIDTDATLLTISAIGSETKSNRIEPDVFNFVSTYVKNITSFVYKNKAYVAVTYGTGATTNNRVYVYDFSIEDLLKNQDGAWIPWTGINAAQFAEYNGSLYFQDSADVGLVHQMNTSNYNDNGTAINSYYCTKDFSGMEGHETWTKDFRKLNLLYEKSGDYFMGFGYRVDSDKGDFNMSQIDLNPGGSLWGSMRWGLDVWGGGNYEGEQDIFLGQVRGKRIQFKFSNLNTVSSKFKILGLKFFYNLKGKR